MCYQPKTGERCSCRKGIQRDNCPACEGTGWRIDFARITPKCRCCGYPVAACLNTRTMHKYTLGPKMYKRTLAMLGTFWELWSEDENATRAERMAHYVTRGVTHTLEVIP